MSLKGVYVIKKNMCYILKLKRLISKKHWTVNRIKFLCFTVLIPFLLINFDCIVINDNNRKI